MAGPGKKKAPRRRTAAPKRMEGVKKRPADEPEFGLKELASVLNANATRLQEVEQAMGQSLAGIFDDLKTLKAARERHEAREERNAATFHEKVERLEQRLDKLIEALKATEEGG